jgi:hypothetical protein
VGFSPEKSEDKIARRVSNFRKEEAKYLLFPILHDKRAGKRYGNSNSTA